jgi:FKBP-type peptidyl-prolyl cis-trans isomerase FkpA
MHHWFNATDQNKTGEHSMRKLVLPLVLTLIATSSFAAEPPKTDDQKTLYAIGLSVARSLAVFNLTPAEAVVVQQGITDSLNGKKQDPELLNYNNKIQDLARERRKIAGEKQAGTGKEFLEKAALEKGAVKTASGMVYTSLVEGKGETPKPTDVVKVNYRGTLIDGREFDSSFKRGKPLEFKLSNVIACWVEGVQKMKTGGKAKLVCPSNLAYGENGSGEMILPNATLVFEVELLEIMPPTPAPAVAAPAAPAQIKPVEPAKK